MSYRALLFCADEKASRAVTQVFKELDFYVESSNEPFDAVKRLTAHHFDALVVDCDNEENATLLFKSARNSASNKDSLAVAIVEGQANIAKAFRLGANLVLTKPINLEQAKGTLRTARGLLRKAEANKTNSAPAETPVEAVPIFQNTILTPVPIEAEAPLSLGTTESEALVKEASDTAAAYLESLQKSATAEAKGASIIQAAAAAAGAGPAKESRWTSKPEILEPKPVSADDAKKPKKREEAKPAAAINRRADTSGKPDTQRFSTLGISEDHAEATAQASKKNFWIAAVIVLALGGGAYFGWTKYHPAIQLPFVGQSDAPAPAPPAPQVPKPPATRAVDASAPAVGTSAAPTPDATGTTAAQEVKKEDPAPAPGPLKPPALVKVPDSVAEGLLIKRVDPNYPDQARGQKIDGLVQLSAKINKLGDVTEVKALHGNPLLIDAATQAVKQWKYRPYALNGGAVNIETGISLTLKP
jgi:TonB family protein